MDRQGRVRQLYKDGTALVMYTGSCIMECGHCGGCQQPTEGVIAQNPDGACPGELVLIRTHSGKVLLAAWMLFIQPILSFFAGYWLGALLCSASKLTGCIALAVSVVIGLCYDRCAASKRGSGYTVIRYPQKIDKGDNGFD